MRHTLQPTVYLIGRNEEEASKIIGDLRSLNGKAKIDFIKSDISLLKNIDESCKVIQTKLVHNSDANPNGGMTLLVL